MKGRFSTMEERLEEIYTMEEQDLNRMKTWKSKTDKNSRRQGN
jgi:hypothetical protein